MNLFKRGGTTGRLFRSTAKSARSIQLIMRRRN